VEVDMSENGVMDKIEGLGQLYAIIKVGPLAFAMAIMILPLILSMYAGVMLFNKPQADLMREALTIYDNRDRIPDYESRLYDINEQIKDNGSPDNSDEFLNAIIGTVNEYSNFSTFVAGTRFFIFLIGILGLFVVGIALVVTLIRFWKNNPRYMVIWAIMGIYSGLFMFFDSVPFDKVCDMLLIRENFLFYLSAALPIFYILAVVFRKKQNQESADVKKADKLLARQEALRAKADQLEAQAKTLKGQYVPKRKIRGNLT